MRQKCVFGERTDSLIQVLLKKGMYGDMSVCYKTGKIKFKYQPPASAEGETKPQCDMTATGSFAFENKLSS